MKTNIFIIFAFLHISTGFPVAGLSLKYTPGTAYKYKYNTDTKLEDTSSSTRRRAVGIAFKSDVTISPVWHDDQGVLFKLTVTSPTLNSIRHNKVSVALKGLPREPIYFYWRSGEIDQVFASDKDNTLSVNIKKGIISLFQISTEDTTRDEIDVCGKCTTQYTVNDSNIKKQKNSCTDSRPEIQYSNVNPLLSVSVDSDIEVNYDIRDDVIQKAEATQTMSTSLPLERTMSTTVTMRQKLEFTGTGKGSSVQGAELNDAIRKIGKGRLNLSATSLGSIYDEQTCTEECTLTQSMLKSYWESLTSGSVATADMGYSYLILLDIVRTTSTDEILKLLKNEKNKDILGTLVEIVTAAQTDDSHKALTTYLNFQNEFDIDLAEKYLLAAAFTTRPTQYILQHLLDLCKKGVPNENLQASIVGALGAVTYTMCHSRQGCMQPIVGEIEAAIVEKLDSCETDACRVPYVRALANAGLPSTLPLMLRYAENASSAALAEQAVLAMRRLDRHLIDEQVLEVMRRIFHQVGGGHDSSVRVQALHLLLEDGPDQSQLTDIFMESFDPWNQELGMFIQARLYNLAENDPHMRNMVDTILKMEELRNYNKMALKAKSLCFTGTLANSSSMDASYFMYVENSRSGIMKTGGMDVVANSPLQTMPIYNFKMFASGMEAIIGDATDVVDEDMPPTAGMALDLMGISFRPITFFESRSGMVSAMWSAPSEMTPAFQTSVLMHDTAQRVHLANGLLVEVEAQSVLSIEMAGSVVSSLWNKNAQTHIKNRGSLVIQGSSRIVTSSFRTGIDYSSEAASVINFQTYTDFYDKVKMCLQMSRPDFKFKHHVKRYEHAKKFKKGYVGRLRRTKKIPAVSYPLPKRNNQQCRAILPKDEE